MFKPGALVLAFTLVATTAQAVSFTYTGTALSPNLLGGTGATAISFAFHAAKAPAPGKCVQALKLTAYNDGARTLSSLLAAGYKIIHNSDVRPITFATLCLSADKTTLSGRYLITFSRNVSTFTETYSITNGTATGTDQLDYYVYAGAVPSIYEDVSASPGIWAIKP